MKQANQDRGTLLLALVAGLSINGTFAALFSSIVPFSVFPIISLVLTVYCLHQRYLNRTMPVGLPVRMSEKLVFRPMAANAVTMRNLLISLSTEATEAGMYPRLFTPHRARKPRMNHGKTDFTLWSLLSWVPSWRLSPAWPSFWIRSGCRRTAPLLQKQKPDRVTPQTSHYTSF